ncbi:MAG: SagB/ThcOx family dehydrogenase [Candidatus Thorarchaeota archaeon]|nr:SagB/ThcOx family dehydrogenase [Candidatus Thorarchaeota archaeon]
MDKYEEIIKERRKLLKAHDYDAIPPEEWWEPDQRKDVTPPPLQKPYDSSAELIDLVDSKDIKVGRIPLYDAIANRKSRRAFTDEPLSLEELSFLLWATQGVREVDKNKVWTKRAVPSGGGRQPFETYLLIYQVEGLEVGIYRYLPIEHKLLLVTKNLPDGDELMNKAWFQNFIGESGVVFVWAAIPYKTEWRYSLVSYKDILIEAGHICQNLYIACEGIGAGTCAIAAYEQKVMDELIQADGENEMTVYISPVGKVSASEE